MERVALLLEISGVGICLPQIAVTTAEIEQNLHLAQTALEKKVGVVARPVCSKGEDQSSLVVSTACKAIGNANIFLVDIDLILFAAAVGYQSIPATAPLIMRELGIKGRQAAAFDVNSTCLSFVTALDIAGTYLNSGR